MRILMPPNWLFLLNAFKVDCLLIVALSLTVVCDAGAEFEDVSAIAGVQTSASEKAFGNPAWVDLDNDGHLDLVSQRHEHNPNVYLNIGDGTFVDVYPSSGLYPESCCDPDARGSDHHGFAWGDYDNDGNMDVFVAEGSGYPAGNRSRLWRGLGDGGFQDVTVESSIDVTGRGALWADVDTDGWLDLLVKREKGVVLFQNLKDGTFINITDASGLSTRQAKFSDGGSFADYDNDGDMDLIVGGGGPEQLYENDGTGAFNPVTFPGASSGRGVAWADYDNDGDFDVFITRGTGDYHAGLVVTASQVTFSKNLRPHESPQGVDLQVNGVVSLELFKRTKRIPLNQIFLGAAKINPSSNPFHLDSVAGEPDFQPGVDTGYFIWKDEETSTLYIRWSNGETNSPVGFYGIVSATPPVSIASAESTYTLRPTEFVNTLYRNDGSGQFTNVTTAAQLDRTGNYKSGGIWGDYDNDGDVDLYVVDIGDIAGNGVNALYENDGDGTFTDVAAVEGVEGQGTVGRGYGAAWGDYDNDGHLDLALSNGQGWGYPLAFGNEVLYRNLGTNSHWLKLELVGVLSNRSAIGSRVELKTNGAAQYRHLNGGGGGELFSQGSGPLHVGLGQVDVVDEIIVKWPSGVRQSIRRIPANETIRVFEPITPTLLGKPRFTSGQDEGVYVWQSQTDGVFHVRVSGGSKKALKFLMRIVSTSPVLAVNGVRLEPNDELMVTENSFELESIVWGGVDGVDFKLDPSSHTLIAVTLNGVANPRQLHVGRDGAPLSPAGWILPVDSLPSPPSFAPGIDLGMFIGKSGSAYPIEVRLNGDSRLHRVELALISSAASAQFMPRNVEDRDDIQINASSTEFSGWVSSWWDGVDAIVPQDSLVGIAYRQDGLFAPHRVNLAEGALNEPNAYWLTRGLP